MDCFFSSSPPQPTGQRMVAEGGEMIKVIFRVQYKLSSIDSICVLIMIATKIDGMSPVLLKKKKQQKIETEALTLRQVIIIT